jgi:hypothetical protein
LLPLLCWGLLLLLLLPLQQQLLLLPRPLLQHLPLLRLLLHALLRRGGQPPPCTLLRLVLLQRILQLRVAMYLPNHQLGVSVELVLGCRKDPSTAAVEGHTNNYHNSDSRKRGGRITH